MNIRHDPESEENRRATRDNERDKFAAQQQHKTRMEESLQSWLKTRPGNVRRAPRKEQLRQFSDAIVKAVFTPL